MDVLDSGTMTSLNDEKKKLEAQLAGISKLEDRLKEVNVLLGNIIYKKLIPLFFMHAQTLITFESL